MSDILNTELLQAIKSTGVKSDKIRTIQPLPIKKKQKIIKIEPKELLKENFRAETKLKLFWICKESTEADLKERKYELNAKINHLEDYVRYLKQSKTKKLEEDEAIIQTRADKNLENINNKLAEYDRIIYLLMSKYHDPVFNKKQLTDRKGDFKEIAVLEPDNDLILHAYIGKNDRPVNCYSLQIIGVCRWGSESYHNVASKVLKLDRKCMDAIDCFQSGANINKAVDHFSSQEEAEQYFKSRGFKGILREFFIQFENIKDEYNQINDLYDIKEFNGNIKKNWKNYHEW